MNALSLVLPGWAKWAALAVLALAVYVFGRLDGERITGSEHLAYVANQSAQALKIVRAQQKVVVQTEIKYRDRIRKIYIKGDTITKEVPVYVTQADNAGCTINAGFVRSHDAAWTGEPAGPAAESDRESSGISLAEVAQGDAFNATACLAWREQAIGLRDFYRKLQQATNSPPDHP